MVAAQSLTECKDVCVPDASCTMYTFVNGICTTSYAHDIQEGGANTIHIVNRNVAQPTNNVHGVKANVVLQIPFVYKDMFNAVFCLNACMDRPWCTGYEASVILCDFYMGTTKAEEGKQQRGCKEEEYKTE